MGYCLPIVSCEMTRTKWLVLKDHIGPTQDDGVPGLQSFNCFHYHSVYTWSTVDWYLLQLTFYEIWHKSTKCSYRKVPEIKSYILSRAHSAFWRKNFFSDSLSLEAIHQSSGSSFRDFFVKDYHGKLTTLLELLHRNVQTDNSKAHVPSNFSTLYWKAATLLLYMIA